MIRNLFPVLSDLRKIGRKRQLQRKFHKDIFFRLNTPSASSGFDMGWKSYFKSEKKRNRVPYQIILPIKNR
jgi:hypothetical protein